jgi:hypothetical protein
MRQCWMTNAPFMVGTVGPNVLTIPMGIVTNLEDKTANEVMVEDAQVDVDTEERKDATPMEAEAITLAVAAVSTPSNRIKRPLRKKRRRRK